MLYNIFRGVMFTMMLFVMACAPSHVADVVEVQTPIIKTTTFLLHLDKKFVEVDQILILDEFKKWESASNGIVNFRIVDKRWDADNEELKTKSSEENCIEDVYIKHVTRKDKIVKSLDNEAKKKKHIVLGFTLSTCETRIIGFVMSRLEQKDKFRKVALHEIGHLVGLDHMPIPKETIMFPSIDECTDCITELDAKQFCAIWKCDSSTINFCKKSR